MTQLKSKNSNLFRVALYEPDIPQNTAAIIRLCACLGARLDIIEPCGFFLNDKKFKRVAMDYLYKCKIIKHSSYEEFLTKKKNSRVILMTTKAKKNYNNFKFIKKDVLLFGRESKGVPKLVHDNSYERLKIPIKKNARSLNVSIAAAITLSEALRQNLIL